MKKTFVKSFLIAGTVLLGVSFFSGLTAYAYEDNGNTYEWKTGDDGKNYWYENGVKQGTYDDPQGVLGEGTVRGREIYDRESDGWYWLDSVYDGAKAVGKEVWMPYIYQDEDNWDDSKKNEVALESGEMAECVLNAINNKSGKWVRYDENGKMLKGWVQIVDELAELYPEQKGNTYYYDYQTGLMAKGTVVFDGVEHYFDETTGCFIGFNYDQFRQRILEEVNKKRSEKGLSPVVMNDTLNTAADKIAKAFIEGYDGNSYTLPDGTNINSLFTGLYPKKLQIDGQTIDAGAATSLSTMFVDRVAVNLYGSWTKIGIGAFIGNNQCDVEILYMAD